MDTNSLFKLYVVKVGYTAQSLETLKKQRPDLFGFLDVVCGVRDGGEELKDGVETELRAAVGWSLQKFWIPLQKRGPARSLFWLQ